MDEFNTENNANEQNTNSEDNITKNGGYTFDPITGYYNYDEPKKAEYMKSEQIGSSTSKKNNGVNWITVVICVVLSLVIGVSGGAFAAGFVLRDATGSNGTDVNGPEKNPTNVTITVDETVNSNIEAVAKKVTPSVVGIRTTAAVQSFFGGSTESKGEGSGVIYSTDGYIITNYHVIESATGRSNASIEVFFSNDTENSFSATVVGYNIAYDLAVIKVDAKNLTAIELANADALAVGQYVAAIGAPGGLEFMGSVSYGIISGLNRTMTSSSAVNKEVSLIQTDAAINPGNSGGALVNSKGQLIGINSSKIVAESFEGMGFAIPVDTVKDICDKIIAKEYNPDPYIGITFSQSWTSERLEKYGYPAGAVVNSVVSGGPASEAGIKSGDIITEFNSKKVKSYDDVADALKNCKPGDTVSVKIYRSGRYYSTAITVSSNNAQ